VRLVCFQHVGLQQGVIDHAAEPDVVVGKNVTVVFEVLANDPWCGIFQQRFQLRQHGAAIELRGRAGIVVRQRQVGGFAVADGEGHPHQFGLHGIEAGGFGVERKRRRCFEPGNPGVELGFGENGFVAGAVFAAAVLFGRIRVCRCGIVELAQPGAEFVALEQGA
jgi:hypothetical protein